MVGHSNDRTKWYFKLNRSPRGVNQNKWSNASAASDAIYYYALSSASRILVARLCDVNGF